MTSFNYSIKAKDTLGKKPAPAKGSAGQSTGSKSANDGKAQQNGGKAQQNGGHKAMPTRGGRNQEAAHDDYVDEAITMHKIKPQRKAGNMLKYERVETFYHREPETRAQFVVIITESGRRMALTPLHLLPVGDCQTVNSSISSSDGVSKALGGSRFAQSARVGECVLTVGDGVMKADRIVKLGRQVSTGIYSPMTVEGALVVDGVLASCFSQLESHTVQKVVYDFLMTVNDFFGMGYGKRVERQSVPSFVSYVHDLSHYVLPFAKY